MLVSKTISWAVPPASDNVTQTIVAVGVNAAPLADNTAVAAPATSVVVNVNAVAGDTINYAVKHSNASGSSLPSATVSFVVPQPPVPGAPTGVVIS